LRIIAQAMLALPARRQRDGDDMQDQKPRPISIFREFLDSEAAGGIILMVAAALALIVANSPLAETYFAALHAYLGPLSVSHWINDGLMAVFFLLVGLEIKREMLDGQLSTWPRRALPGIAAAGGMLVPALVYVAINRNNPAALSGWAIPTATDIAFALGVLSLLGSRVPGSLKVFLTALAIIDDLGAVIIIAVFYTSGLSLAYLGAAFAVIALLIVLNRMQVLTLLPYLVLGLVLWVLVLKSGVHATLAGVALALTIPLKVSPGISHDLDHSPLHRLEHGLHRIVPFFVIPIFGFANAGVSLAGLSAAALVEPLTLGVAAGLVAGKLIGVFGSSALAIRLGFADLPVNAGWLHMVGISLLCGIGFTMSLFIGLLAFASNVELQDAVKVGILAGSFIAAILGAAVLLVAPAADGADEDEE
jgi:NhaA family Na+:H+ antiporter